ncbi:MAG: YqiA/YcfP family alpha/beta fold hydrolase [Candidatus Hermodarchaeota archaeon]
MQNIIFVHGLESSGTGFKARLLKEIFPNIHTPTFKEFSSNMLIYDILEERMIELTSILETKIEWIIIGSSFGGLMSALYTLQNPSNVKQLILLAPFLESRKLKPSRYKSIDVPVIVYHGSKDKVVSYKASKERAKKLFNNLQYNIVDDDHSLHRTVQLLRWKDLIFNT